MDDRGALLTLAANWISASLSLFIRMNCPDGSEAGCNSATVLSLFYAHNTPIDKGFHQLLFSCRTCDFHVQINDPAICNWCTDCHPVDSHPCNLPYSQH